MLVRPAGTRVGPVPVPEPAGAARGRRARRRAAAVSVWGRIFALAYDPFLASAERRGIAAARRDLLADAHGRVLEIGAGTGLNVAHYPAGLDVVYTEPDPHMARRLRARVTDLVEAPAEALPFADGSFDTVVSTLVLCTVSDVPAALAEIRRVLRPGGRLLFLEHVRAPSGSRLEHWQDRLHGPWKAFACGCHCNRDLPSTLREAGFDVDAQPLEWRFMPAVVRPGLPRPARPPPFTPGADGTFSLPAHGPPLPGRTPRHSPPG